MPCDEDGRFGSRSSTGVRAPCRLLKDRRLASLRLRVWPSSGDACSPSCSLRADVDEFRLDGPAEDGVLEGIRAIGGRCSGDGACICGCACRTLPAYRPEPDAERVKPLGLPPAATADCRFLLFRLSSFSQNFRLENRFFEVREPRDEPAVEVLEMTEARREELPAGEEAGGRVCLSCKVGEALGLADGLEVVLVSAAGAVIDDAWAFDAVAVVGCSACTSLTGRVDRK